MLHPPLLPLNIESTKCLFHDDPHIFTGCRENAAKMPSLHAHPTSEMPHFTGQDLATMLTTSLMFLLMACAAAAGATNSSNMPSSTPTRTDMRKAIGVTIDSKATWGGGFNAYLHIEINLR